MDYAPLLDEDRGYDHLHPTMAPILSITSPQKIEALLKLGFTSAERGHDSFQSESRSQAA
jgi:hypothetical protein